MRAAFPCEYVIRIRVAAAPREYRSRRRAACHFIMFVSRSIEHSSAIYRSRDGKGQRRTTNDTD